MKKALFAISCMLLTSCMDNTGCKEVLEAVEVCDQKYNCVLKKNYKVICIADDPGVKKQYKVIDIE